jgi:uncharacterized protein YuzE
MKITYDQGTDALYIRLLDEDVECRTVRLNEEVALDFGPNEALVGIEILDASQVLRFGSSPAISLENIKAAVNA